MTVAGQLRERVEFELRATIDDGYGNPVSGDWVGAFLDDSSPQVNKKFAARIKPARGGESIQAARLAGHQPVLITVRSTINTRTVKTEWRVRDVHKDVIYNIRSIVNPDEKNFYLDMECDAGVAT